MKASFAVRVSGVVLVALMMTETARADWHSYGGIVTWVEVWRSGNVAFRLSDATSASACNGQFILNASDRGTKNQYAALLAAKKTGSAVNVYSGSCGAAENYGGNYINVDYLYVVQD